MTLNEPSGFVVMSPDGFDIQREGFHKTEKEAKEALAKWVKRFEVQGYYKTGRGDRIPLAEIADHCTIYPVWEGEES
jgi:hypothetical protein